MVLKWVDEVGERLHHVTGVGWRRRDDHKRLAEQHKFPHELDMMNDCVERSEDVDFVGRVVDGDWDGAQRGVVVVCHILRVSWRVGARSVGSGGNVNLIHGAQHVELELSVGHETWPRVDLLQSLL